MLIFLPLLVPFVFFCHYVCLSVYLSICMSLSALTLPSVSRYVICLLSNHSFCTHALVNSSHESKCNTGEKRFLISSLQPFLPCLSSTILMIQGLLFSSLFSSFPGESFKFSSFLHDSFRCSIMYLPIFCKRKKIGRND